MLAIADAVGACLRDCNKSTSTLDKLGAVLSLAHSQSRHGDIGARNLEFVRAELCSVCRNNDLYECDVADGWSTTCRFLRGNVG